MSDQIKPSDSYARFLVEPSRKPAPKHIKKLLPKYRITHFLGAGGFADVYEGTDENGWGVAIKVPQFKMEKTMDTSALKRFASEADIWKKLQHENIVTVYETGAKPIPHIVMELMDGGDLETLMNNHRLTVSEAVHIMVQVLEGISYAHRMATVHRDLKPENILFTSDGVAKITDWGIGKYMASEGLTKTLDTKGTLAYSAPEQFNTKEYGEVDWQTDIFQLGIVFYEMLTGVKPFEGKDMAEIMGKVLTYNPVPPSEYNSNVPSELEDIVMGALEKEKEYRWESGAVMLHEMKLVITGQIRLIKVTREERKIAIDKRHCDEIVDNISGYYHLLKENNINVSIYDEKINTISGYAKLGWYDEVNNEGSYLLMELKKKYDKSLEIKIDPNKEFMQEVKELFQYCLNQKINIDALFGLNERALEAYNKKNSEKAKALFLELINKLKIILSEDKRNRFQAKKELQMLRKNPYKIPPPENLENLIEDNFTQAKKEIELWKKKIDARQSFHLRRITRIEINGLISIIIGAIINVYSWYLLLFTYDDLRSFNMDYFCGSIIINIVITLTAFGFSYRAWQLKRNYAMERSRTYALFITSIVLMIFNVIVGFMLGVLY